MEQKKLGEANQIQQMQGLCEAGIPGNGREQEFPLTPAPLIRGMPESNNSF